MEIVRIHHAVRTAQNDGVRRQIAHKGRRLSVRRTRFLYDRFLSPADRRIILFADGTWAVVDSLGGLSVPSGGERLVLAESGSWTAVTASSVRIPELRESAESEKPASSSGTVRQTAPPPPADGSAVYHTIVSGDTLSGIAKRYGTTVQKLCNLNGITVKTTLRPGRKLRVK